MSIRHIVICAAIVVFPIQALYSNPQVASNSLNVFSVHPENYPGQLTFTDITLEAGTGGPTRKDELGGHGVMFTDVDEDGLPDLYITMIFDKPMPELFFRNLGNNTFSEEGVSRRIADFDGGSHGACWADLDNDGDYDLVNGTTWDNPEYPNHNNIFRNNGNGTFTEVTPQCMRRRREETRGVICFDAEGDGDLDIFCVSGWKGSGDSKGERNEIYENKGNFNYVAIKSGPLYDCPAGQGATDTDYDCDGDVDVMACNRDGDLNVLRNDGGLGNFTKIDPDSIGISHRAYGGVTTGDIDNDGDLDMILVDARESGYLYFNDGDGKYIFIRSFSKVDGYMAGFADLDNDADIDLVFAGDKQIHLNDGSGTFSAGTAVPVSGINDPRAIAFADIDNDGDMDFAVGAKRSRNWLLRNDYTGRNNWLKVKLISPSKQAGAFGARVKVYPAGKRSRGSLLGFREAKSNYGYLGQDDPVLHFGLGRHQSVSVVVTFPDGSAITKANISANQIIIVDGSRVK
ncbi:MAG: CRTAC1 family protein [Planctomycetes bacterium]|nr:CRTAC1 family protein [Planctomycetota bacterium]